MNRLKILIVEDDLVLAEQLREELADLGYVITDVVSNSDDAQRAFKRQLPDLLLCDISLNNSKLDGIGLVDRLNKIVRIPVVFLTAFGDEATTERAKSLKPAYYLIKPHNPVQLQIAIDFALDNYTRNEMADPRHSLSFQQPPPCLLYSADDFFFVKDGYTYVRINVADIVYVEALGSTVRIVTDNNSLVFSTNLSSFIRQVTHQSLLRIHRSYLVNSDKIISFERGRTFLAKEDEKIEIPVGQTYREDLQQRFPRLLAD